MIQYPNVIAFFSDIHFLIIIFDKCSYSFTNFTKHSCSGKAVDY